MSFIINFTGTRRTVPNFATSLSGNSLSNFNAAADLELVEIDAAGYNSLLAYATATAGANNANMTSLFGTASGVDAANFITSQTVIPAGQGTANFADGDVPYLVRLRIYGANTARAAGAQLGFHTNVGTGTQAGTAISNKSIARASITSDANGFFHYVVKNPSVIIAGNDKVPRIFAGNNAGNPQGIRFSSTSGWSMYQDSTGNTDVTNAVGGSFATPYAVAIQVHSL